MRPVWIWMTATLAAIAVGCGTWSAPDADQGADLRAGLERTSTGLALVLRRGPSRAPHVEARCAGVRLVVVDEAGPHEMLASFLDVQQVGGRLVFRCVAAHSDHSLTVAVTLRGDSALVEVLDEIALPTRVAELSVAYELRVPGALEELLLPGGPTSGERVSGDSLWRTPLAYARAGARALALLPETAQARPLPGALEAWTASGQAILRHGLLAHTVAIEAGTAVCQRDPKTAPVLVGTTLRLAHDLRLITDATPRATAAALAREVFEQGEAATADTPPTSSLRARWTHVLAARAPQARVVGRDLTIPVPAAAGDEPVQMPLTARANVVLVALALAQENEPRALADARALLQVANAAPHRAGLSPRAALVGSGGIDWQTGATAYDATAIAWTRTCMLRLARILPRDDPIAQEAIGRAAETVAFLLDSQRPDGAIPARFDSTYLAPEPAARNALAPESGAAALLLAEWASTGREPLHRALDAATAAVQHLVRDVLPRGAWQDSEVVAAQATGQGSLAMTFAALAALRLYELRPAPELRDAAVEFLDQLSFQQQSWSPPWLARDPRFPDLRGGMGRHDNAARWSDPACALTGWAFLIGYEHTGRIDYLRRGALAVRAAVLGLDTHADGGAADLFGAAGVAAAVAQLVATRFGDAVIDLGAGAAVAIESLALRERHDDGPVAIQLRRFGTEATRHRVRFFGLPPDVPSFPLRVNDAPLGAFGARELGAGVELTAVPWPVVGFAPPTLLQEDLPFEPRLMLHAPAPLGWTGEIALWADDASPTARPLWRSGLQPPPSEGGAWRTKEPVECLALRRSAATLRAAATLTGPDDQKLVLRAVAPIRLGPVSEFSLASIDVADCVAGDSRVVVFGTDARLAREVAVGGTGFTWRVTLASTTGEVELELDLAGPLRLLSGGSVLTEEAGNVPRPHRTVTVRLADRRLWESGVLDLRFEHAGGREPLRVSTLRTRMRGVASGAPSADALVRPRQPARRLDVAVIPVSFPDAPLIATRDQLQAAFFGEGYLRTPPPQARATAGSVRELVTVMSGGRTQLDGFVVEPVLARDLLAADVAANPEVLRELAVDALRTYPVDNPGTRVCVIVHGGPSLGPTDDGLALAPGEPPVVALPDLARDLSLLPVGRALAMVLGARFGLQRRTTPDSGNLGALTLTAHGDGHLPSGPLGLDLVALGWADLVDLQPGQGQMLVTAPVQRDRRVYRLTPGAPGRGELFLEGRGGGIGEPGLPRAGLLLYWRLPHPPLIGTSDGRTAHPTLLRLLRSGGAIDAAFVPGAAEDLVQRANALDDRGIPSLATPEGELFFRISQLAPVVGPDAEPDAGPFGMSVEDLSRRLTTIEPTASAQRPGAAATPLATDGVERGSGHIVWQPRLLRFETAGSNLRAMWPVPDVEGRALRLFAGAALSGRGTARIVVGSGDIELASATIASAKRTVGFVVDLPTHRQPVWIEVQPATDTPRTTVRIDRMIVVPRARADHVALRQGTVDARQLMDGFVHAPVVTVTAGRDARARHVEPIVLPAGRTLLRVVCGLGFEVPLGTTARIDVSLRSIDGRQWAHRVLREHVVTRGAGTQPLLVALLEIPSHDQPRTGLLDIVVSAAPDTPFHLVTVEVTRP